jgi:hypothetical protein
MQFEIQKTLNINRILLFHERFLKPYIPNLLHPKTNYVRSTGFTTKKKKI